MLTSAQIPCDAICQRLHIAALHTVVINVDRRMTVRTVIRILDVLGVKCAVLVGDRAGGELAWRLAAEWPYRFTGLVVVDAGHPRAADSSGIIRDQDCPAVEINTTVLTCTSVAQSVARASQRYVYGDFRLVQSSAPLDAADSIAQLSTEIVLRSAVW